MKVKFFNPGKEFELHKDEYTKIWKDVRSRGALILRDDVEAFERAFAKYVGTKYAVGLNSGTDALLIALKAIGIKKGDEVLVPSHTFVATAQVVQQLGARVVLYDMDGDVEDILKLGKTKVIILAHIAGEFQCEKMNEFMRLMKKNNIFVIEDACQALGAMQNGKKAGAFGHVGAFSFYPAKILGGPGDGGALVTNDKKVYEFAKEYRNHWKKGYSQWGINSRLSNVIASELSIKLKRLDKTLQRRQKIADMYYEGLKDLPVELPKNIEGRVFQDYVIQV